MRSKTIFALMLAAAALLLLVVAGASAQGTLPPNEELGKKLFFDTHLSSPARASLRRLPRPGGRLYRPGRGHQCCGGGL